MLLAGSLSPSEAIAGLLATGIAAWYGALIRRRRSRPLALRVPWLHVAGGVVVAFVTDSGRVGAALARVLWRRPVGPVGRLGVQPFVVGGPDAAAVGRRGVVTLALSMAPNGIALGVQEDGMTVHQLAPDDGKADTRWPA